MFTLSLSPRPSFQPPRPWTIPVTALLPWVALLGLPLLTPSKAVAQEPVAYFPSLVLDAQTPSDPTSAVSGSTGGSFSLTALSNYDDEGNLCVGYSYDGRRPNHILELKDPLDVLSIWVTSANKNTTLFIQGPNSLDCADDQSLLNLDAAVSRSHWSSGIYRIWVGSRNPDDRYDYQLNVQPIEMDQ